tara:strand:+ start:29631 stop:29738 length:108 start_codon:yes stop_codon:yes gene_type:complete
MMRSLVGAATDTPMRRGPILARLAARLPSPVFFSE